MTPDPVRVYQMTALSVGMLARDGEAGPEQRRALAQAALATIEAHGTRFSDPTLRFCQRARYIPRAAGTELLAFLDTTLAVEGGS